MSELLNSGGWVPRFRKGPIMFVKDWKHFRDRRERQRELEEDAMIIFNLQAQSLRDFLDS